MQFQINCKNYYVTSRFCIDNEITEAIFLISLYRFNYIFGIILWLVVWLSPAKLNIGVLNVSLEYLLFYLYLIVSLFCYGLTVRQLLVFMAAIIIVLLDLLRSVELIKIMPLGFLIAAAGAWRFSRGIITHKNSYIYFILMLPIVSIVTRLLYPEFGMIEGNDTLTLSGVETKRLNLLTYESNSVALMLIMFLVPLLFLDIIKSKIILIVLYIFICVSISLTFSRSGMVSLIFVILWAAFFSEKRKEIMFLIVLSSILLAFFIDNFYGHYVLILDRLSALNYLSDTRGDILQNAVNSLIYSDWGILFGLGFWNQGITDNTLISLFIAYGMVFGLFIVLSVLLFVYKIRLVVQTKILIAFFVPFFIYALTVDIFGQAKLIAVLALMINISISYEKRYPCHKA